MNLDKITSQFLHSLESQGKKKVFDWCIDQGLITSKYKCPKCNNDMKLYERKHGTDGFEWRCRLGGHHVMRSIRRGSWFAESHLSIIRVLLISYYWVHKVSNDFIVHELSMSSQTVTDWKRFCRELCVEFCDSEMSQVGGDGIVVEICENKLEKRKFNKRKIADGKWIFGGVEKGSNKYFLKIVKDGSKESFLDFIKSYILPGTTIISDCFKTYSCLEDKTFQDLAVSSNLCFKFRSSGSDLKNTPADFIMNVSSVREQEQLAFYFAECVWRKNAKKSFARFLGNIKRAYPPQMQDDTEED